MSELWKIFAIFGGAFVVGFSGAVVPGPMFAATVMHARSRGWLAGVLVSSGHALVELPMVVAIALGAGLAFSNPLAARAVAVAGGAVLVVMGVLSAARPPAPPRRQGSQVAKDGLPWRTPACLASWRYPFLAGAWTSVSQPFWFIWWATAGAGWVMLALAQSGPPGAGAFYVGHILSDFAWFTFVAAAVGAGRREKGVRNLLPGRPFGCFAQKVPDTFFRAILRACGVALVAFGLLFVSLGLFWPEKLKGRSFEAGPPAGVSPRGPVSAKPRRN